MKYPKTIKYCILIALILIPVNLMGADADIHGIVNYSDNIILINIFADITPSITGFSVKLNYPASELTLENADKNQFLWFLGDNLTKYDYIEPYSDKAGEIIITGGILNTEFPAKGIKGTKILLGSIYFTRKVNDKLPKLSLSFGQTGKYKNFVTTDGIVLDDKTNGVHFASVEYDFVELADVIRILQILTGDTNNAKVNDIDGNNKIEMKDVLGILHILSLE